MSVFIENKNTDINDRHVDVRIFQHPMGLGVFADFFGPSEIPAFTSNGQWWWAHLIIDAWGTRIEWLPPFASPTLAPGALSQIVGAWTTVDPVTGGVPTGRIQATIKDNEFWTDHGYHEDTYKFDGPKVWEEFTTPLCEGIFDEVFWRLEAKRTNAAGLGQISVAGTPLVVPYFHTGLTQAKAYVELNQGGECSLDRVRVEIPPGTNKNYVFMNAGHFGQLLWRGGRFASPPLPLAATEVFTAGPVQTATTFVGTFAYLDRSTILAPGRVVTKIALDVSIAGNYPVKIARLNSPTNVDVVYEQTVAHNGNRRQDFAITPFTVPDDGKSYHVVVFMQGGNHFMYGGKQRSYSPANITGNGVTMTADGPALVIGVGGVYAA